MVTSPYEWKILEWDDKPTKNKPFEEKRGSISYWNKVPFISGWFVPRLVEIDPVVIEKNENENILG